MPNPVVHFEFRANDRGQSQEFYSNLFGWQIDNEDAMNYGMINTNSEVGIGGGIAGPMPDAPSHPGVTVYVEVDDLQAYLDKAESLGGKTIVPPMEIPDVVALAMFSDIAGNVVGLVKSTD